jgi:hypothetical protein
LPNGVPNMFPNATVQHSIVCDLSVMVVFVRFQVLIALVKETAGLKIQMTSSST